MNCDEEIIFFLITLSREIKFMFISFNLSNLDFFKRGYTFEFAFYFLHLIRMKEAKNRITAKKVSSDILFGSVATQKSCSWPACSLRC